MTDYIQIQTALPARTQAQALADALVERGLAACVQVVGPTTSTYRWQGAIEHADEWVCVIKTENRMYDAVAAAVGELHPYETPEIIATPIVAGSEAYLRWISDSVAES